MIKKILMVILFLTLSQKAYSCPVCMVAPGLLELTVLAPPVGLAVGGGLYYVSSGDSKTANELVLLRSSTYTNYNWINELGFSLGTDYSSQGVFINGIISPYRSELPLNPYVSVSYFAPFNFYKWQIGVEYFFNDFLKVYTHIEVFKNQDSYLSSGITFKKTFKYFNFLAGLDYTKAIKGEEFKNFSKLPVSVFLTLTKEVRVPVINKVIDVFVSSFILDKQFASGFKYAF